MHVKAQAPRAARHESIQALRLMQGILVAGAPAGSVAIVEREALHGAAALTHVPSEHSVHCVLPAADHSAGPHAAHTAALLAALVTAANRPAAQGTQLDADAAPMAADHEPAGQRLHHTAVCVESFAGTPSLP